MYGSELLTGQERKPLEDVYDELLRTFLKGILKLKSINLATKHKKRLSVLLRIPTLSMEVEKRCMT